MNFIKSLFKKIIWLIVIVAIIIIAICAYLAFLFDFNKYKPDLEAKISGIINKDVKILGDIEFKTKFINPAIILNDVNVSDISADKNLFYISELGLTISALSLKTLSKGTVNGEVDLLDFGNQNIELKRLNIPFNYQKNNIVFDDINGDILGGKLSGTGSIQNGDFKLKAQIKDAEYISLIKNASGNADIKINLNSKSNNFINSLDGDFKIIGGIGNLNIVNINPVIRNILRLNEDKTKVKCLIVNFAIDNGIANSKDIFIDSDRLSIDGEGQINLVRNYMDLKLTPNPKDNSNLTTAIKLSGDLNNIKISADREDLKRRLQNFAIQRLNPRSKITTNSGSNNSCAKLIKKMIHE